MVNDSFPGNLIEINKVELREIDNNNLQVKGVSSSIVNKLAKYREKSKVKVAALNVFLHMVDQKDIEHDAADLHEEGIPRGEVATSEEFRAKDDERFRLRRCAAVLCKTRRARRPVELSRRLPILLLDPAL